MIRLPAMKAANTRAGREKHRLPMRPRAQRQFPAILRECGARMQWQHICPPRAVPPKRPPERWLVRIANRRRRCSGINTWAKGGRWHCSRGATFSILPRRRRAVKVNAMKKLLVWSISVAWQAWDHAALAQYIGKARP